MVGHIEGRKPVVGGGLKMCDITTRCLDVAGYMYNEYNGWCCVVVL